MAKSALCPGYAARLSKVHASTLVDQARHHAVELQALGAGGWQGAVGAWAQALVSGSGHTVGALLLAVALEGGTGEDLVGTLVALFERKQQQGR